ncbi:MAG TPA: hypothetical protein PKW33_16900 [Anaerolineaceae bacterium]|nr:hypothetical protein [Anaerolineaceae bacterium]HPN53278.1 hypothetical protein [Anaerolineaceae bacterium]
MNEIVQFFKTFEAVFYIILGLAALVYLRKLILAFRDVQGTIFGMERDLAQGRLSGALSMLTLLGLMALGIFLTNTFIYPDLAGTQKLPTPTVALASTSMPSMAASKQITPEAGGLTPTPDPTATPAAVESQCLKDKFEWTDPTNGAQISGVVELIGTIQLTNFGFYKYEYTQPGLSSWTTIAAGNDPKKEGTLGFWDTTLLPAGDYLLRLVATDNQGAEMGICVIGVKIAPQ